jgi:large subunit ribosomal protein L7/L12
MNEWLSGGGALPSAWEHPRGPGDYPLDVEVAYGVPFDTVGEFPTNYRVTLVNAGPGKIKVVSLLRKLRGNTPQTAFRLVNNLPWVIEETFSREIADDLREKFEALGAEVVILEGTSG